MKSRNCEGGGGVIAGDGCILSSNRSLGGRRVLNNQQNVALVPITVF